jgi:hypothetical protein
VRRAQNEFLSCLKAGKTGDLHSIADGVRHAGLAASAGVGMIVSSVDRPFAVGFGRRCSDQAILTGGIVWQTTDLWAGYML